MPFQIIRDDITRLHTDAIVNAANPRLAYGGGVCGAIFQAAGIRELSAACAAIGGCETGQSVITPGFQLKARHVIHTVGPVWQDGNHGEAQLLRSCYHTALTLAARHELRSVAFPLISGGIYGYPKDEAMQIAVESIRDFLTAEEAPDMDVILVLYERSAYLIGSQLFGEIRSCIDEALVRTQSPANRRPDAVFPADKLSVLPPPSAPYEETGTGFEELFDAMPLCSAVPMDDDEAHDMLANYLHSARRERTFSQYLLDLIDRSGEKDSAVYRRANLDRRLFSKIRSNPMYQPGKATVLALCMALKLDMGEAEELLSRAGYAFSPANVRDVAVQWCLNRHMYDVFTLNSILFEMDQPGLGMCD